MSYGLPKVGSSRASGARGNKRPPKLEDSDDELPDFNPQVFIKHIQSDSDDEKHPMLKSKTP